MTREDNMSITTFKRRTFLAGMAATGGLLAAPHVARAQSYATRPVRIIVQNAAGGSNDTLARFVAPTMEEYLGQPVIVENRPGAAGNIGFHAAMTAKPDGHTLLCSSVAILAAAHTSDNPPGNPVTDLEHITQLADGPFRFAINPDNGISNFDEFLAHMRANPGSLRHGTPGFGGNIHLLAEIFKNRAGIDMPAVHYNAVGNILTDLLGNEIQVGITGPHHTKPYIESGQLVPLMTTGPRPDPNFPEIPTAADVGLPDVQDFRNWFGLHAPKNTPQDILDQVYNAAQAALTNPDVIKGIEANNFVVKDTSPAEFAAAMKSEDALYAEAAGLIQG